MPVWISFSALVKKVWINSQHPAYYSCLTAHPVFMGSYKAISTTFSFDFWWWSPSAVTLECTSKLPLLLPFSIFFFSISNSAFVGYWLCPATTHTRNVYFQLLYIIYFLMSLYKFLPHHLEPVWRLDICEKLFRDHFWKSKWLWQPVLSAVGTHLMRAPFRHSWLVISIFLFWNKSGNTEMNSFYFCL